MKILARRVRGMTIIEVIVASTLLMGALGVAVTLVGSASIQIAENRNRITATYLLQECLELTRNVRDSAARQNVWHCPFFPEESAYNESFERTLSIAHTTLPAGSLTLPNCSEDYGARIREEEGAIITLNGTDFTRTLTISDLTITHKNKVVGAGTVPVVEGLTATCGITWAGRTKEYGMEAATVLTHWQKQ